MEAFEASAIGKTEPLQKLCDQFDRETQNGTDMSHYDKLLSAVIAHIGKTNTATQITNLGIGGRRDVKLPVASEAQHDDTNFQLVTWLILTEHNPS